MNKIDNFSEEEAKEMLETLINNTYTLVPWPESQDYMEEDWFEKEAFLEYEGKTGSSAYFIPTHYILTDDDK